MGETITFMLDSDTATLMRKAATRARMSVSDWSRAQCARAALIAAAAAEQHLTPEEFVEDAGQRAARKAGGPAHAPNREARSVQRPSGTRPASR